MTVRFSDTSFPQRVIFGAGEIDRLDSALADLGIERVILCTSDTYRRNGTVGRIEGLLGDRLCGVFAAVRPHVPQDTVAEVVQLIADTGAQGVMALGGGSTIGTAKAATARAAMSRAATAKAATARAAADSAAMAGAATAMPATARASTHRAEAARAGDGELPAVIAIPTTYAGSEMTAVYGTTSAGKKRTARDPRILPCLVLYDPDLTLDLPPDITAGTGANALAHCVEGTYSLQRTPLGSAAALAACRSITTALPLLMQNGTDRAARAEMLIGAHLAGTTLVHAGMALHHAICHALGGAGLPHGVANAIVLPHVMRYNLPAVVPEIAAIGRAAGVEERGEREAAGAAVERVTAILEALPLPHRLRDTDLSRDLLPAVAAHTVESSAARANPRPASQEDVGGILRAAW